jgi:starch-binding outer membrane protein, SusD/RagB family
MKTIKLFLQLIVLSLILFSCKNYVTNVDPLVTDVEDSQLNTEKQIPFLIRGVEIKFGDAFGQTDVCSAGLSDAFIFPINVPAIHRVNYIEIDEGKIQLTNNDIDAAYDAVGQLRFYADDLVRRVNSISISDISVKNNALFTGYFYGGYARYLYAAYFGLNPTEGGSPIDNSPFIGSKEMYDLAIGYFVESIKYLTDELKIRIVNSVIARAYLYKGDYAKSVIYAKNGMINDDAPFLALYNTVESNAWWANAGNLLSEFVADFRFKNFIDADPNEANRIKLDSVLSSDNVMYYFQAIYPESSSPQKIITWQENNLIKAELILRGMESGNAKELVNEVRASHGIAPLSSVDLDMLLTERDKELFASGNRLVDERRFNKWHLGPGTWEYLPVTEAERNGNPNIN